MRNCDYDYDYETRGRKSLDAHSSLDLLGSRHGSGWIIGRLEEADEHFVPRLLTEEDLLFRVGIVRVTFGIVKGPADQQPTAGGDMARLLEIVTELPFKVVTGNIEQRFSFPIGQEQFVTHPFAAEMHVRE